MVRRANPVNPTRLTMLEAAARIVQMQGVHGTSIDDILKETGTGKSQFYHYFGSKENLVRELLRFQVQRIFERRSRQLSKLNTPADLEGLFGELVEEMRETGYLGGCPVGTLASEMADTDEPLRLELARTFSGMQDQIAQVLQRFKANGMLKKEADPHALALLLVSAFEGSVLLSKTMRNPGPLQGTLKQVGAYIRSLATINA